MNVLITGGTSGMGLATSKLFSEKGHTVLIADINEERGDKIIKQLKMISDKVYFFKVNLADVQEIKKMYDYSSHEIGFMNCVVNNAGIFESPYRSASAVILTLAIVIICLFL